MTTNERDTATPNDARGAVDVQGAVGDGPAEVSRAIQQQAEALGPLLYTGMATALASAAPRVSARAGAGKALKHSKYPHLLPLLVRSEMREYLEDTPAPNDWKVGGNSKLMGQLTLTQTDLNWRMAFLKERRRTYPGGVPTAGKNRARQQRWVTPALDLGLKDPSIALPGSDSPLNLLLLWDFKSATELDQFHLRIAHTREAGTYGRAVLCDLLLDVEPGGGIHTQLRFEGHPEDEDLFQIDIAEDENSGS